MKTRLQDERGVAVVLELVLVAVVLLAAGLWAFQNNGAKQSSPQPARAARASVSQPTTTKKTITLKSASYTLTLPSGWTVKEIPVVDPDLENLVYIIDPTNKIQLETQIMNKNLTSGPAGANLTPGNSFVGLKGKTYFLSGYKGSSSIDGAYEVINITSCADKHCYTPINNEFDLNLSIRAADLTTPTPTKLNDPNINNIEAIIKSIQF